MSVTLYYGSGSPFAWRVWLALEHKHIPFELKVMSFAAGDLKAPDYLALNPRGKVPVLVDNGEAFRESAAILEYIDERWPSEPRLFATDARTRARQRRLCREADGYVGSANEHLFLRLMAGTETADLAADAAAVRDELHHWEAELGGDFLAGPVSAADFTLYPHCALVERIGGRKPGLFPADVFGPRVGTWMARMKALPIVQKTWPPHWKE